MENGFKKKEIKWRTFTTYVDIDTGEILTKQQVIDGWYIEIKRKRHSNVYKQTGTVTIEIEVKKDPQARLWS